MLIQIKKKVETFRKYTQVSLLADDIKDNLKLKMAQYVQNNNNKEERVQPEPPLQKMKLDKKEEKDDANQKNDEYIFNLNKDEFSKEIKLLTLFFFNSSIK